MKLTDDQIRELCDKATEGPWEFDKWSGSVFKNHKKRICMGDSDNNSKFIAAARELVPQLLGRAQRAEQVISSIVNLANEGKSVWFAEDWGGNTLTAQVNDAHTHVGAPEGSLDNLIKDLHALFVGGKGLNWVRHGSQEKEG